MNVETLEAKKKPEKSTTARKKQWKDSGAT